MTAVVCSYENGLDNGRIVPIMETGSVIHGEYPAAGKHREERGSIPAAPDNLI